MTTAEKSRSPWFRRTLFPLAKFSAIALFCLFVTGAVATDSVADESQDMIPPTSQTSTNSNNTFVTPYSEVQVEPDTVAATPQQAAPAAATPAATTPAATPSNVADQAPCDTCNANGTQSGATGTTGTTGTGTTAAAPAATGDPATDLCSQMQTEMQKHASAAQVNVVNTYNQAITAQNQNPTPNPYGDVKKTQCISLINNFFNTIQQFLSDGLGIQQMIVALINNLVNQACQYVANAINSALASVCIPIPKLSLSLSLPSTSAKSCDGLSLQSLFSVQATGVGGGSSSSSSSSSGSSSSMSNGGYIIPLSRGGVDSNGNPVM